MTEYIERSVAVRRVMETKWERGSDGAAAMEIVASATAADVVPVVRCANCKYLMLHLTDGLVCGHSYGLRVIFRDSFCPYGEYQMNGGVGDADD